MAPREAPLVRRSTSRSSSTARSRPFPQIDFNDGSLSGGIGGGRAQIQGLDFVPGGEGDRARAADRRAARQVRDAPDRTDISATLGKDSLSEAWKAAIGGIILVAIFLLLFYRFLGLVAVTGLAIYAAFLYAMILIFNGDADDAGIGLLVRSSECRREHRHLRTHQGRGGAGRSVRAAIAQGYRKGFATIIDANVVTAITAMVLFVVATASVPASR